MSITLDTPAATAALGSALAAAVIACNPLALLLRGALGAGKTTLARALVLALPGGDSAEIASPSFTICNIYSTAPPVHHFDLYRLDSGSCDETLEESLDDASVLSIVEWSEHLSPGALPIDGLVLHLEAGTGEDSRRAKISALGPRGERCLTLLHATYPQ